MIYILIEIRKCLNFDEVVQTASNYILNVFNNIVSNDIMSKSDERKTIFNFMKSVGLVTDRKEHLESKKKLNLVE
jgi:hypothetical protein